MANQSYAYGVIDIKADSPECVELLKAVLKLTEISEYDTTCTNYSETYKGQEGYYTSCDFTGTGCGNFEDGIQFLFQSTVKYLIKEEIAILEGSNFEISYDFTDYEPGTMEFYTACDALRHKAGNSIMGYNMYVAGDTENLDLSWGSRLEHHAESLDSMMEFMLDMYDEDVYNFLEEEKVSLEDYFHKPFTELLDTTLSEVKGAYLRGKKASEEWDIILGLKREIA